MRDWKKVNAALAFAKSCLGLPYIWGGQDPEKGYDCSGLVVDTLKHVGILPPRGDWGAAALSRKWQKVKDPSPGCLVFFGKKGVTHVGIVDYIGPDFMIMIEAGGGGSKTKTLRDAVLQNAWVRRHSVSRRKDLLFFTDPFLVEVDNENESQSRG